MVMRRGDLHADPFAQLRRWIEEARSAESAGPSEPITVSLATVDALGLPSVRLVPIRAVEADALVFSTGLRSAKGADLIERPDAVAGLIGWTKPRRQVRFGATAELVGVDECDRAFGARGRDGQIGAWVRQATGTVDDRSVIEARIDEVAERFRDMTHIPRPEDWRLVRLRPTAFEFWQAGSGQVHDRFRYVVTAGGWTIERLWP